LRVLVASLAVVFAAAIVQPVAQQPRSAAARLPPVVMSCPHHPDVVEDQPGACPICRMPLAPVRVDAAWMCPVHQAVVETTRGTCRLCARPLVPVAASLTFVCRGEPGGEHLDPGVCADGTPRVQRRTLRPHGNHNTQHGGQFFMAPDNWHHLEGSLPRERTFRLYLYDDFARPLKAGDLKQVQARVVTQQTYDPATRKTKEITAFPLRPSRDGAYLEARIDSAKMPLEVTARVRFKADAPEYPFDFTFAALTKEPVAPAQPRATATRPAARPALPTAASPPAATVPPAPAVETDVQVRVPDTIAGILEQLTLRDRQVRELLQQGNFAAVWVPAFQAKDLAIALEPHLARLSPPARAAAEPAVQRVVRMAWLLDAHGDTGNRQQLESAYAAFGTAVADTMRAFSEAAQ
jgi:hypothetical protein